MADRGQAHTLEAIVAGVLILSSLVFALQVTAVTPLSASTASQHIENQQDASAKGVLATAADRGALKRAILFWNDTENVSRFHEPDLNQYYTNRPPPNQFGEILEETYKSRGLAYNVYLIHEDPDTGALSRQRLMYRGQASDHAVTASWTVTVYDSDVLYDAKELPTKTTVSSAEEFYMEDASPDSVVFNVVRVEVVVWRM
jgi:hypothetical protein